MIKVHFFACGDIIVYSYDKRPISPLTCLYPFVKNNLFIYLWVNFWLYFLPLFCFAMLIHRILITVAYNKSWNHGMLVLQIFFSSYFGSCRSFRISLSIFTKHLLRFLLGLYQIYVSIWGKLLFNSVESSKPWVQCVYLFMSLLFVLFCNFQCTNLHFLSDLSLFHIFNAILNGILFQFWLLVYRNAFLY